MFSFAQIVKLSLSNNHFDAVDQDGLYANPPEKTVRSEPRKVFIDDLLCVLSWVNRNRDAETIQ